MIYRNSMCKGEIVDGSCKMVVEDQLGDIVRKIGELILIRQNIKYVINRQKILDSEESDGSLGYTIMVNFIFLETTFRQKIFEHSLDRKFY